MKKLLCINTYEEDLTGFDDFAVVWKAGKTYDATHHKDGTWTVKTEQNKDGIIGEEKQHNGGYACNYDTHFVDVSKVTLLDAVRYAYNKGYDFANDFKATDGPLEITDEIKSLIENGYNAYPEVAEGYLSDMLSVCKIEGNVFDSVIKEWIGKAEERLKKDAIDYLEEELEEQLQGDCIADYITKKDWYDIIKNFRKWAKTAEEGDSYWYGGREYTLKIEREEEEDEDLDR